LLTQLGRSFVVVAVGMVFPGLGIDLVRFLDQAFRHAHVAHLGFLAEIHDGTHQLAVKAVVEVEALAHQRGFQSLQRVVADFVPDRQAAGNQTAVDFHAVQPGKQLARFFHMFRMLRVEAQFAVLARTGLRHERGRTRARLALALFVAQLAGLLRSHPAHR
jgi:hypothetical protein